MLYYIINMKSWGFYDDENDGTLNYISDIEKELLPTKLTKNRLKRLESSIETVDEDVEKLREKLGSDKMINVIKDKGKVFIEHDTDKSIKYNKRRYEYIMSHKNDIVKKIKRDLSKEAGLADYVISGVGVFLARGWTVTSMVPEKFGTHDRGFSLPKALPSDFPESLKKIAYHASVNQLNEFDNHEEWTDSKLRKKALKYQIELFK
jgi:hypothetical protein